MGGFGDAPYVIVQVENGPSSHRTEGRYTLSYGRAGEMLLITREDVGATPRCEM
jgi:hypothetical protein